MAQPFRDPVILTMYTMGHKNVPFFYFFTITLANVDQFFLTVSFGLQPQK